MTDLSLLKLLQLSSPSLPVGAFAYSQGLESAIELGIVNNKKELQGWLLDSLRLSIKQVDLPLLTRLHNCWEKADFDSALEWNAILRAQRETSELRNEDHQLGIALARLLKDLGFKEAESLYQHEELCFLTLFTLAASKWNISVEQTANGFIWSWLDNQIAAALKLVPLGQTDGQRVMSALLPEIPSIIEQSFKVKDKEVGASLPMMAIISSIHETQYSRLFRS